MVAEEVFSCFTGFLRGVLGKVVCRTWFLCGEFMVDCVVFVDNGRSLFSGKKWDTRAKFFLGIREQRQREQGKKGRGGRICVIVGGRWVSRYAWENISRPQRQTA